MSNAGEDHFHMLFQYAPISLWEEDYSGIKRFFDDLRARGVIDFIHYIDQHPTDVDVCMQAIKIIDINLQTLEMFGAKLKEELLNNLHRIFRDEMRTHFRNELIALWNGNVQWSGEGINYTLADEPLDILLHWRILPGSENSWEHVLVTIENVTARKQAERALTMNQVRFRDMFEASPISLWEEDYSDLKNYFDSLKKQGISDFQEYIREHPEIVLHCANLIKVINVNQKTLQLFGASTKEQLISNTDKIFRDSMSEHFAQELIDLWNNKLAYEREGVNYSLNGEPIQIHLDFRIMPGHEQDFGWVVVAIQDITARKKAEDYLRYLGTHDVMTGLYNRAYFDETLGRMDINRREPISIMIIDLNGLKAANDNLGHQAGDNLIRRAAEVIKASLDESHLPARIGGDEFVIIMPDADERGAVEMTERIRSLVAVNNKFYRSPELSLSIGAATSRPGISLEKTVSLADNSMYNNKAQYYRRRQDDR
ncbi:MAG TPA: sensor domain-containing diguanylate cyclase [Anaerolineales bacterium]